ncbi:MAG: AAA family ATPase, partial [Ilumatobacteraceae bacterium]
MAVAGSTARAFEQLSAVSAGVRDVREVIERARQRLGEEDRGTILFLDEIHRFNKAQQDALLPAVEDGSLVLIGATTENPFFEVNPPLRSRSTLFRLEPLGATDLRILVDRGLEALGTEADDAAVTLLVERSGGDGRQVLTSLEVAAALADPGPIELRHSEAALSTSAVRYGRDDHYDVVSAFIKSMRGSDPDASIYWLARMLEAGEDPRFVARRIVI